jgi:hypothetical protein
MAIDTNVEWELKKLFRLPIIERKDIKREVSEMAVIAGGGVGAILAAAKKLRLLYLLY